MKSIEVHTCESLYTRMIQLQDHPTWPIRRNRLGRRNGNFRYTSVAGAEALSEATYICALMAEQPPSIFAKHGRGQDARPQHIAGRTSWPVKLLISSMFLGRCIEVIE